MDFFDPEKQKQHSIRLAIGYAVIGVVLLLATTILLYRAYGYGLDKQGRVIQSGLVFASSRPDSADIYLNGKKYKDQTNTRMDLPSGQYVIELKRDGYHDWKRALTAEGGRVERFDYPVLFPKKLTTTTVKQYAAAPGLASESLDRRWLLVATPDQNVFDLFDMNQAKLTPKSLTVPAEVLAAGSTTTGWQAVEWSKDNRHVLLRRLYQTPATQSGTEYIMIDREQPEASRNLSVAFGFTPTRIELRAQNYDQYYLFDQVGSQVFTASLEQPTPLPYASGALGFASEGDTVVYVTTEGAPAGKVLVQIRQGDDPALTIRQVPAGTTYLMDMAVYDRKLYLAAGASSENRIFLYADPIGQLKDKPKDPVVPVQILKVVSPNHISFSANKRFVIAENADNFAVYDAETDRGYAYRVNAPMDPPQARAVWMDGYRLSYVSGGKVVVFDFDGTNLRALSASGPSFMPIFDRNYRFLYTVDAQNGLTSTALLTAKDL